MKWRNDRCRRVATSPGDVDAIEASCGLADLAEEYPELLYVQEDTLEEGLKKLNERAEKWVYLTQEEQDHILKKVNGLYSKVCGSALGCNNNLFLKKSF